jgi:hypothetical protein
MYTALPKTTGLTKHLTNFLGNLCRRTVLGSVDHQNLIVHFILHFVRGAAVVAAQHLYGILHLKVAAQLLILRRFRRIG